MNKVQENKTNFTEKKKEASMILIIQVPQKI